MMRYIVFSAFLFISMVLQAQRVVSPLLKTALENAQDKEMFEVNLYCRNDISLGEVKQEAQKARMDKDARVRYVLSVLEKNAQRVQPEIIQEMYYLQSQGVGSLGEIRQYKLGNMIYAEMSKELVLRLAQESTDIVYMDLNTPRYRIDPPVEAKPAPDFRDGNTEPGLLAVNAHAMWALGYTGRNCLFLSMDTGVNPDHPAIAGRFLGRHMPLEQVWFGLRHAVPMDHAASSHGTHTTGTVLGLDNATQDTIGMAWNAYWIASDPVASDDTDLLAPEDFMSVFDWVLNPDGNTETTSDVPDVINNSWGYDYDLALTFDACNMAEAEILEVLEAANIMSPFSAGNEGPNASTIGFPAMMAYSDMNAFSVGAVNGNNENYPITDFSSRGPTTCLDASEPNAIKPEVVAPGYNVRSCSGHDAYSFLSGTSMSCPHVSGALLLLREAFPQVDAYTLKKALYSSAHDLGASGEDNVYGKGMIDVHAAYEYLKQTYDTAAPVSQAYDLVVEILSPVEDFFCPVEEMVIPEIRLTNQGDSSIQSVNIEYSLNDATAYTSDAWSGELASGESFTMNLNQITLAPGLNFLHVKVENPQADQEFDMFNNAAIQYIKLVEQVSDLPYHEGFEEMESGFLNSTWINMNPDRSTTWEIGESGGLPEGEKSLVMPFFAYTPREGQLDAVYSPMVQIPDTGAVSMSFAMAYKKRMEFLFKDSLRVWASDNCGASFDHLLYENGGEALATVDGNTGSSVFVPENAEDWDTVNVDVSSFHGDEVMFKIEAVNDAGAYLYIDDLRIYAGDPIFVPEERLAYAYALYPNPAKDFIIIEAQGAKASKSRIAIYDMTGKILLEKEWQEPGSIQVQVSDFSSGVYTLRVMNDEGSKSMRFVK